MNLRNISKWLPRISSRESARAHARKGAANSSSFDLLSHHPGPLAGLDRWSPKTSKTRPKQVQTLPVYFHRPHAQPGEQSRKVPIGDSAKDAVVKESTVPRILYPIARTKGALKPQDLMTDVQLECYKWMTLGLELSAEQRAELEAEEQRVLAMAGKASRDLHEGISTQALVQRLHALPSLEPEAETASLGPASPCADDRQFDLAELTAFTMAAQERGNAQIAAVLHDLGMVAVKNNGTARGESNNCFFIALAQHALRNYSVSGDANVPDQVAILAGATRKHLMQANLIGPNEMIPSGGPAADSAVAFINGLEVVQPKLHIHVVSRQVDHTGDDQFGVTGEGSRRIVIWDRGGHFEAVVSENLLTV
ncbi:hypothetical protein AB3X96_24160 [Paraburkholderia sp. BR13439]|uniref:hypothetical protein n=1 Tax=Paraburkholderia sp. BR13439 TaxID=3236996 RepID=UPI0034CE7D4F